MRLDKFLKVSRLIKRRTVANEACSLGRVSINGKTAKPSSTVAAGDVLELRLGSKILRAQVLSLQETAKKDQPLYQLLDEGYAKEEGANEAGE